MQLGFSLWVIGYIVSQYGIIVLSENTLLIKRLLVATQSCRVLLAQLRSTRVKTIGVCAFDHNFDQYKATNEIITTTTAEQQQQQQQ